MLWMSPLRQGVLANRPGIPLDALIRPGGKKKGHPGNGETAASPDALLVDLNSPTGRKTIASAELGGGSSKFHVLTVPFIACRKGRAGSACEPWPGLHENCLKHVARFPERFLTTPSADNAPRHGRNRDDVALTPSFNLHGETVHQRLLSLESRQGSSVRKDALSKPPTQPLRMDFPTPRGRVGLAANSVGALKRNRPAASGIELSVKGFWKRAEAK